MIADLILRAFDETPVPPSQASALARFEFDGRPVGIGTSATSCAATTPTRLRSPLSGFTGSVLTNIDLIDGLQDLLDDMLGDGSPVTSFGAGNIILGGDGSDIIEGRGGDDLIDGDAWLNVQIGVCLTYRGLTPIPATDIATTA